MITFESFRQKSCSCDHRYIQTQRLDSGSKRAVLLTIKLHDSMRTRLIISVLGLMSWIYGFYDVFISISYVY